ncbi:hypothetical protein BVI2075_60016 [Burkholderia vietnamiensis]|nr:hypothetical protein BVI2075_60016 [Burkholderia vietnamiensis]
MGRYAIGRERRSVGRVNERSGPNAPSGLNGRRDLNGRGRYIFDRRAPRGDGRAIA